MNARSRGAALECGKAADGKRYHPLSSAKLLSLFFLVRNARIFVDCRKESLAAGWSGYLPGENGLKRQHRSEENVGLIFILFNRSPIKVDSSEKTTSPRIREYFGFHLPVGISCGLAAHWSGSACRFCPDLELTRK